MALSLVPLSAAYLQVRRAVGTVLRHLDTALQGDVLQIVLSEDIKFAVENCARACTAFQTLLDHWMRHSMEERHSTCKL
jgi:uncharacterized membrane protein YccC